jgi:hypothetical protein
LATNHPDLLRTQRVDQGVSQQIDRATIDAREPPPGADVEQPDHQQGEPGTAGVARNRGKGAAQPHGDVQLVEVASEELEAAVRRPALRNELDGEITLDHPPQTPYLQAHQRGLLESRWKMWGHRSIRCVDYAPLMPFPCGFSPSRISDQG